MKVKLRQKKLINRNNLSSTQRTKLSELIVKKILNLTDFKKAKTILFYFSFGSEVETIDLIKTSVETKTTLLPLVLEKEKKIIACKIKNIEKDLENGFYNIPEPKKYCKKYLKDEIDLVLVPGVSFGIKGERLGYGGGFYDKFLENFQGEIIGICFESQLSNKIIIKKHDIKMHKIVTEKRIISCRQ